MQKHYHKNNTVHACIVITLRNEEAHIMKCHFYHNSDDIINKSWCHADRCHTPRHWIGVLNKEWYEVDKKQQYVISI